MRVNGNTLFVYKEVACAVTELGEEVCVDVYISIFIVVSFVPNGSSSLHSRSVACGRKESFPPLFMK